MLRLQSKMVVIVACGAFLTSTSGAFASELMDACLGAVERDGHAEGADGCDCLVDVAGDSGQIVDELIEIASQSDTEQDISAEALEALDACFPSAG